MASDGYPSPQLTSEQLAAAIAEPPAAGEWKLYWDAVPPPSQAALLTLSCLPELQARVRLVRVNVMRSQQLEPEFRALCPLHEVPVLQEPDGTLLTESRAIMVYLAELGGPAGATLYPASARGRAACHRWMLFDVTCLYPRLKEYHLPVMLGRAGRPNSAALPAVDEALSALNAELQRHSYVTGDALTVADLGLAVTVAQVRAVGVDLSPYTAVAAWYERLRRQLPGLRQAERGSAEYAETLRQIMDDWDRRQSGTERGGGDGHQVDGGRECQGEEAEES